MEQTCIPPEQLPGQDVSPAVRRIIHDAAVALHHVDTPERSGPFRERLGQEASRLDDFANSEVGLSTVPYVAELITAKMYLVEATAEFASGNGDEADLLQKAGVFGRAVEQLHRVVPRHVEGQSSHPALMRRASGFTRIV